MERVAGAVFVRIRIYRISLAPILRFPPQVARAVFVRIRIYRIGEIFRILLAPILRFSPQVGIPQSDYGQALS